MNHNDIMTIEKECLTWVCQKCRWVGYAEQMTDKSECPNCGELVGVKIAILRPDWICRVEASRT